MPLEDAAPAGAMTTQLDAALGWARKYSIFQYPFVT
ncbi:MAG: NADH-quinone oxidoreductase subunit B, partial [Elusimicrobia bacterium]|nr:NADH-quinone oxidoreductase subunit B [Elusimicrobiota bacterium]